MRRPTKDETFLAVAKVIGARSLCESRKVGAVIVDRNGRIVATGYNGPPAGFEHGNAPCAEWCERRQKRAHASPDYRACPSVHAEMNALLYADRAAVEGGTLYITHPPCVDCSKVIANSGVSEVKICAQS